MSNLTVSLFIDEETSPLVDTLTAESTGTFDVIRFGPRPVTFTLFVSGGPKEALDYWDRLRRACIEAIDRTQRRLDAQKKEEG